MCFIYNVGYSIQILTDHEGNGGKVLSRGETHPWPTIHRGRGE